MEQVIEKWSGKVNEVVIGNAKKIKIGGEATLPFLHYEAMMPNKPVVAMEVWDMEPPAWPAALKKAVGDVIGDPVKWAKKCVDEFGAEAICLRLASAHPENKNSSPEQCAETVKKVLKAVSAPLIILGCGNAEKDNSVMPKVAEAAKGENCLIGTATNENYKTIAAACISCGHNIIAESPIDVNLCKQLNILISDMGFAPERIVVHQSTGALGYGFEYTYSIMERARLAALQGDKMLAQPMMNLCGQEVYRIKETKADEKEKPEWGALEQRAPLWEAVTAAGYLQSGSDLLVMCHPKSVAIIKKTIEELMSNEA